MTFATPTYYLCVGHSHLDAIRSCYTEGRHRGDYSDIEVEFVDLHSSGAVFEYYHILPDALNPDLIDVFGEIQRRRGAKPSGIFMSVGGSNQHSLAMLNHEQPMDVVVPWDVQAAIAEGATLLPFHLMQRIMHEHSGWKLNLLTLLSEHFSCPKYFLQAPPPIASEDHLRSYPGPKFEPLVAQYGFSPLPFRRKIAEIHSRMYQEACERNGVAFLFAPSKGLDESGCLSIESAAQDSIHASVVYGGYVIEQMQGALKGHTETAA